MKTIFFLQQKNLRYWTSCDEIEEAFDSVIHNIDQSEFCVKKISFSDTQVNEITKIILDTMGDDNILYFLSHNTNFNQILIRLDAFKEKFSVIIPIFGDMTIQVERWLEADKTLRGWRCKLLCSSIASKQQISEFVKNPKQLEILKSPLSLAYFEKRDNNSQNNRFTYIGRISYTKNILPMMQDFIKISKLKPMRLDIYGWFDDIGYRFYGIKVDYQKFQEQFYDLIEKSNGAINYKGHLPYQNLNDIYLNYKYLINLSTYLDEDLGLVINQALASGCTPILTKWGGFHDHKDFAIISTRFRKNLTPTYNSKDFCNALLNPPRFDQEYILNQSLAYHPSQITIDLLALINSPWIIYQGQTDFFYEYAHRFLSFNREPYYEMKNHPEVFELFKRVYKGYFKPE